MSIEHCDKHKIFWLRDSFEDCPICSNTESEWASRRCSLAAERWLRANFPFHITGELIDSITHTVFEAGIKKDRVYR